MKKIGLLLGCMVAAFTASPLHAGVVTNEVIFGTGNLNQEWTIDQSGGVELGLRAKVRFDAANNPQNIFNSDGNGTYTHESGQPVGGGFGFAPFSPSTAKWNFEWSINSDYLGSSGVKLDELTYRLDIDFDPTAGTNFLAFDPINQTFADHAIGDNTTANGAGTTALNAGAYSLLIGANNLAQNSWNMEFFDSVTFPFNANQNGIYSFQLTAFDGATQIAQTAITVNAVPEPSTILCFAFMAVLPLAHRRRRKSTLGIAK